MRPEGFVSPRCLGITPAPAGGAESGTGLLRSRPSRSGLTPARPRWDAGAPLVALSPVPLWFVSAESWLCVLQVGTTREAPSGNSCYSQAGFGRSLQPGAPG